MSHPAFSKGAKSLAVVPFPLGMRTDLVIAQASHGARVIKSLMRMPSCSCCILSSLSDEMCPNRSCHKGAGSAFRVSDGSSFGSGKSRNLWLRMV